MKRRFLVYIFLVTFVGVFFSGCDRSASSIARIWTNQSDFVSYVELFNNTQDRYRIVVEYRKNPAEALIESKRNPDIIIGPWLKGVKARNQVIPVDYLFNELRINSRLFYKTLLDLGAVKERQYLLPVSFNLPVMLFPQEYSTAMENDYSISLDHIQHLSQEFTIESDGLVSRMGFSPRWNSEFLFLTTQMFGTRFEEGQEYLLWNEQALATSIDFLRDWSRKINSGTQAEDDFQFKYLYDPPYRLVTSGKSLFSFVSSDELLKLPHDKLLNVDFRWLMNDGVIPVSDNIVYMGICRKAKNLPAAEAFMIWFFKEETQRALLERSREMGLFDQSFGLSGGFSSLQSVNERAFPLFYPILFGHLPPPDTLSVPRILPNDWDRAKAEVIIPFLEAAVLAEPRLENPSKELAKRLVAWQKKR